MKTKYGSAEKYRCGVESEGAKSEQKAKRILCWAR